MTKKSSKKGEKEEVVEEKVVGTEETQSTEEATNETAAEEQEVDERSEEEKKIEELGLKVSEINDKYLRLSAEYDNYRKRTLKERMELQKSAGEGLLKGMLPVVDDFDRALAHLTEASDLEAVKEGIGLIYNKLQEYLKQNGVTEIEAKEKEFDTDLHEAITNIPAPTEDLKGKVIDCVEKGYMLNDKVMRFAKVVVGE
ncbi:nucleotide exchange factor GrpE [Saccharicrinis aurantiacus]|uniref:nucleotide exchange factor GrpE n=1 Tax=Saccharicrinis aurantiacus TaxID=1849719 RepID=UPI000837C78F|nr:nucleotide exchange factor GrpE [Saccharicrinis aurantiacus]